jgi:SWI/SNF-related matrix-associated actin-dependent regulator 1 of chromatin subfamily A
VICPASLRLNWKREAEKWLVRKTMINVMTADWVKSVEGFNIINYDILKRLDKTKEWDLLIADECHMLKNMKTIRAREVMGYHPKDSSKKAVEGIKAKKKILMTGTPIVNRPVELYSLIHFLDPQRWSNFFWFAKRFCGGTEGRYGWDMSGATNLDELQDSLRSTILVRRLKKDVLKELPPKRRQIIEIPANGCAKLINAEKNAYDNIREAVEKMQADAELARAGTESEYRDAVEKLKTSQMGMFSEISKLRHETALAKVPYVVAHAIELLEDEDCLVIMAHHRDVIEGIRAGLKAEKIESVQLTGEDSMENRQKSVDDFQAGKVKVFVGSIHAAGVGITLTKASTVLFAELDWVPGNVSQAEDRLHRIGQAESVLVQHIVLEGSIDCVMAKTIVEKQSIIDQALDVMVRNEPVLPLQENRQTGSRIDLQKLSETLSAEDILSIHSDLMFLAGMDKDHANVVNGMGFNKIDGRIGHSLAALPYLSKMQAALGKKILGKYKRQLD